MKPGLHEGIDAETYHGMTDYVSNSRLAHMVRSPAYAHWRMTNDTGPTQAQKMGTARHYAVLEPEKVDARYIVAGKCAANVAGGRRCSNWGTKHRAGEWWCGVRGHAPALEDGATDDARTVLSQDEMDQVLGCRDSVHANKAAAAILTMQTRREVTMTWEDKATGLDCKGRIDILCPDIVSDLKSTRDAHPTRIERGIANAGIHRQGAFYLAGLHALGRKHDAFVIIAVEPDPPWETCVYALDPEALRVGAEHVRKLLAQFKQCLSTGSWPGYPAGVQSVSVPVWCAREQFPEEFAG